MTYHFKGHFCLLSSHQVHLKRTTLEKKAIFTVMNIVTTCGIYIKTNLSETTEMMFNINSFSNTCLQIVQQDNHYEVCDNFL